ncbi:MAG: hypothetical protein DRI71_10535 [Bacteroidetes bacterium]|nr:MAG: hypothetical protein DRI71_10535 [Bacteroidota bacterium]
MSYRRIKNLVIFTLLFGLSSSVYGQSSEDKLGSWYIYNGFFNFNPTFELFVESQLRNWETFSNPENFFFRPFFNYNLNQNFQTGLSLEYHKTWTYDENPGNKVSTDEFRTTMQVMLHHKISRVALQHRYRYEFRWVDGNHLQRTRYRVQATVPINNATMEKGTIFFNTNFEFMVDTKPSVALSQLRNYFAGGYQFTDNLNLQLGYMVISRTTSVHHRLQFFLTHKLFFYEK